MTHVVLLPGLGADCRLYADWQWPPEYQLHRVEWQTPLPNETLTQYAHRLLPPELPSSGSVVLVGVSFGGIVAQEMARQLPSAVVVLISTIKSRTEMPFYFGIFRRLPLYRWLSVHSLQWLSLLSRPLFGRMNAEHKLLFGQMLRALPPAFLPWAMHQVLHWQPPGLSNRLVHLHGTADLIFPARLVRNAHLIAGGSHYMVTTRVAELLPRLIGFLSHSNSAY